MFRIETAEDGFVPEFIRLSEENAGLADDEILWFGTGYWSVKAGTHLYIGCGEETFQYATTDIKVGVLALCLDANDFCVLIKRPIKNGRANGPTLIDIYCSAYWRPIVEILEPFRKAIAALRREMRARPELSQECSIESRAFHYRGDTRIMVPDAIATTTGGMIGPTAIKNHFGPFHVEFLFSQVNGGWLKSDFFRPGKFWFSGRVCTFGDIDVIDGQFHCQWKGNDERTGGQRIPARYETYLGLFPG